MFKQVMSSLGDSVRSTGRYASRTGVSELASDKLTSIISAGLTGIGARSPLLSDITSSINDRFLATVAIEKERNKQYKDFISSEAGTTARKEATKSEPQLSQKKIDSQMMTALSKITQLIDRSGIEEAKKTDLYKKYETYYTEFKKTIDDAAKKQSEVKPTQQSSEAKETGGSDQLLVDIEANTKHTVDALLKGGKEPVTIKGAAQHIGGTFLNKVFNDDMISRMAGATTAPFTKFGGTGTGNLGPKGSYIAHDTSLQAKVKAEGLNEETTLESAKQKEKADEGLLHSNEGILANTDKILEYLEKEKLEKEKLKDKDKKEPQGILDKMLDDFVGEKNTSETTKEVEAAQSKRDATELAVDKQTLDTLKKIEEKTGKGNAGGEGKTLIERALGGLVDMVGKRIPGLGSVLSKGASIAGSIATGAKGMIARAIPAVSGMATAIPGLLSTAGGALGNAARVGANYLPAAGSAAKMAASGGVMMAGGAAVDSALGAMGVGGNEIDTTQDDKNWERASVWEKIQSAPARGIEKLGGSIFLDNIANEARQKRITSETEHLDSKEGKIKADKTPTTTANKERDLRFQEELDDANSDNTITPEWKKNYAERLDSLKKRGVSIDSAKMIARMDASNDTPKHSARTSDQTGADTKSALESQKKSPGSEVERLTAVKDTQTAAQTAKAAQPIVINNTSTAPSTPTQAPVIAITPSIRNQDSTFERTQMKDFWARTF